MNIDPISQLSKASSRSRNQIASDTLRSAGAGRISDSFLIPVSENGTSQGPYFSHRQEVRWREHAKDFWIRVANVPFDLLPFRQGSQDRVGAFFSIGPGLVGGDSVNPCVLLLQIEGPNDQVDTLLARIELAFDAIATDKRRAMIANLATRDWRRVCLSGIIH
jgi:hypothetical protein